MEPTICPKCGRNRKQHRPKGGNICDATYSYAVHDGYGCDTGCCGHRLYLCDKDGNELDSDFEFDHPYNEDHTQFAIDLCKNRWPYIEVRIDLCEIIDD